jgi:hypothetical protein
VARRSDGSRKERLAAILAERHPALIDPKVYAELEAELAPISESYLHSLLRESGVRMHPLIEGVSLHSHDDLRRTLLALAEEYESGDHSVRQLVIQGKVRLRALIAHTTDPDLRHTREQMHTELMTWLENPTIFPLWLKLLQQRSETMEAP